MASRYAARSARPCSQSSWSTPVEILLQLIPKRKRKRVLPVFATHHEVCKSVQGIPGRLSCSLRFALFISASPIGELEAVELFKFQQVPTFRGEHH